MSYELHITRAAPWTERELTPIARDVWNTLARSRRDLVEDGWIDWLDIGREPVYYLGTTDGPSLRWRGGEVTVTGAEAADLNPLVTLATALAARVLGDDGEEYAGSDDRDSS